PDAIAGRVRPVVAGTNGGCPAAAPRSGIVDAIPDLPGVHARERHRAGIARDRRPCRHLLDRRPAVDRRVARPPHDRMAATAPPLPHLCEPQLPGAAHVALVGSTTRVRSQVRDRRLPSILGSRASDRSSCPPTRRPRSLYSGLRDRSARVHELGVPLLRSRRWWASEGTTPYVAALLLCLRIGTLIFALSTIPSSGGSGLGNDAHRYHDIATTAGRPYRDFQVEVPPLAVFGFEIIGGADARSFARRLAVATLAADTAIALILLRTWGRGAAYRYWVIGTPLSLFIYLRVDLISVLLAVIAVAV